MSQNARESLSALMDNEGDELELRRVLKSLDDEPDAADTWRRYHLMRSMLRRESDIDASTDLSVGVMARLQDEPLPVVESSTQGWRSLPLARSAGVAAAVSLMVITGVQFYNGASPLDSDEAAPLASSADAPASVGVSGSGGATASTVAATPDVSANSGAMRASQGPSLADLPMFQSSGSNRGLMTVGADAYPMMISPSQRQSVRMDQQQARLLQSYLDRHAEGAAASGADVWMPLLRSTGSESLGQR
ncbi:sigma-E factor negative regulatory protein [Halomonas eurihalina]|uniref:Sigma-E factor negative regulatory protein n=1 Tax=Halomonas eurihalina TaxID=42566 RepID=A0A5D9CKD5_HALER|nr:sigma-E factor negative regulatory protein [Halomonas eurihalina]MDR5860317.1 sigma-E factor negative regulatory protein [Halomonas eurihalina]TZG32029.1 sigma-E factor negative regulatory protein [Halomonas eurihalina]